MALVAGPPPAEGTAVALMLAVIEATVAFGAACAFVAWTAAEPASWTLLGVVASHGLAISLCGVAAFYCLDLYDLRRARSFALAAQRLPRAVAVGAALLAVGHAPFVGCTIPQLRLLASGLAALVLVVAVRATAYWLVQSRLWMQRVLVIGGGRLAQDLISELQTRPDLRRSVVGLVDDGSGALPVGCLRLGRLAELSRIVEEVRPHRVIVALEPRRGRLPLKALLDLRLHGIVIEDGVEVYESLTGKIAIEAVTPSSVIFCAGFRARRLDLVLTRILSVPVAAVGLVVLAPLLGLIALAIKVDSRGPVFFVHERVGRGGKRFRLVKFRTMHPARSVTSEWVRDNDARLTRVGRWLRRFRFDELPQLLNIVTGSMNLVGPRPHPVGNVPLFVMVLRNTPECGEQIPYYALRSMVRPGLTGWAQVRYHYANDLEEEVEKMRYDLYYIKHMSAWLDLRILLETVKIVLHGRELAQHDAVPTAARPPLPVLRPRADAIGAAAARTPALAVAVMAPAEFEKAPGPRTVVLDRPVTGA